MTLIIVMKSVGGVEEKARTFYIPIASVVMVLPAGIWKM